MDFQKEFFDGGAIAKGFFGVAGGPLGQLGGQFGEQGKKFGYQGADSLPKFDLNDYFNLESYFRLEDQFDPVKLTGDFLSNAIQRAKG